MSMDPSAFEHHFKKLRGKWKSAYTDDMAMQVYEIVKEVPQDAFSKWIDSVLWIPHAPDRNAFYELARKFRRSLSLVSEDSQCPECDGHGNMSVTSDEGYDYWFACISCDAGASFSKDLPRWKPGWLKHGWKINRRHTWKEAT